MRQHRSVDARVLPARGFTLIEAVAVIALLGIVGAMVAVFMREPVTAYVDLSRRAALTDAADLALRRITREVQQALPNSVRVDASGRCLELLPLRSGGRYRAAPRADGTGDFLDLNEPTDNSFEVLGPSVAVAAGDQLVVHNLGVPGADAYAGDTRRALTVSGAALANLSFTTGGAALPFASPDSRFHVVGAPVSLVCQPGAGGAGSLRRYAGYAIGALQPADASAAPLVGLTGAGNALLAGSVAACSFSYTSGASARNGIVTLRLTLSSGGESVSLLQQVHVENTP